MATDFTINLADLQHILDQIIIAERHAAGENLVDIIGQDAALLPFGLRTVDGSYNNLLPGQSQLGAADQLFPRLLTPDYRNDADGDVMPLGPPGSGAPIITNTNYALPGSVADADPRIISNLISDQTIGNMAALSKALSQNGSTNPFGDAMAIVALRDAAATATGAAAVTAANNLVQAIVTAGLEISNDGSITIPHESADIGLSPPNSGWMTIFGQFFDHGLDLVTKGGNGTVYIPLQPDDPLYVPGGPNFMAVTRVTPFGADGTDSLNTTTPFVDQNQTYTSVASHQVFLREYTTVGGKTVATGALLEGVNGGIGNWAEVKAQALNMLGIKLTDFDVHDVPLLLADPYGKFIPDPVTGYAQVVTSVAPDGTPLTWVSGTPGAPVDLATVSVVHTGHAFLNDIAHHAAPGTFDHDGNPSTPKIRQTADLDIRDVDGDGKITQVDIAANNHDVNGDGVVNALDLTADDHVDGTYDNEMLDSHFVTGDGRGNENIGLTTVHFIFHAEHNRIMEVNKSTLLASNDLAVINQWLLVPVTEVPATPAAIDALVWNGERLFQAARFTTEMQYQHMVFEEFARRIQPNVDPFVFTNSADLNPAILAEFAHTVYRFGHSMLTDTVDRLENDLTTVNGDAEQIGLIQAFLNPQAFTASSGGAPSALSDVDAASAIIRGMSRQVGNEIDEFVVEALRNNLVGLPLDLPAINMARGRETGIPALNNARAELYAMTGHVDVKPYTSWLDFAQHIKNPISIVNFIAAYGTHDLIEGESTLAGKRAAAMALVLGVAQAVPANPDMVPPVLAHIINPPTDRLDFLNANGIYAGGNLGGLNVVDLWIGGLAEEINEFGGQLGSTFNFVFEYQLEHLQNGDRFYYLSRTQGMNFLNQLEPNTFADIIMRNTNLGDLHATHLSAEIMEVPDMVLELDTLVAQEDYNGAAAGKDPTHDDFFQQMIDPKVVRINGTTDIDGNGFMDGNVLKFSGGEHVVLGGTEGNDRLYGDKGIDTLWGDGGDDYLNAGMESDQVFGGEGDDIIEDPFGDDFLRGEAGNDVIVNGAGLDILFGGTGNDFIMAVTDTTEVFAGQGNDFILGGSAPDGLMGNEGDDWIEGGEGFDGLSGENSQLFFNSTIVGHDILNGQGNDTDYDGENGDDIMVQSSGIQRNNGMDGFDWAIHKGDAVAADSDLGIRVFDARPALILRDRFDSVEGLSGWKNDDILTGAAKALIGENFSDVLTQAGVDRIHGMRSFLGNLANGPDVVFESDTNVGGEIILGGDGSDTITGNLGDDILDGDAWLNVRISIHQNKNGTGPELATVDTLTSKIVAGTGVPAAWVGKGLDELMRAGAINPGQLEAVREILYDTTPNNNIDKAVFTGNYADYAIEGRVTTGPGERAAFDVNGDGFISVTDNVGTDGTDLLKHIEMLQFADQNVVIAGVAPTLDLHTQTIITTTTNFSENFGSTSYTDTDGTGASAWTQDWVETGDDGSSTSDNGQIRINGGALEFDNGNNAGNSNGASITRAVDLSGATSATLSFSYNEQGFDTADNETVLVQFAADGINFTTVQTINSASGNNTSNIPLTGTYGASSAIRFVVSAVNGNDDIVAIDNIIVAKNVITIVPGAPGNDYATTYTENGAGVAIASVPVVTDPDSPMMTGATVKLTNAQAGDVLSALALPAGITASFGPAVAGQITLNLTGSATQANYQTAIQAVRYSSTSDNPNTTPRVINVTVNDGTSDSNIATATVTVVSVDDPMVANNDRVVTNIADGSTFTIPEWVFLANDTDIDGAPDITSVTENSNGFSVALNASGIAITDTDGNNNSFTYTGTSADTANVDVVRDAVGTISGNDSTGTPDILIGNAASSTFDGGTGNDFVFAGAGDDTIIWNVTNGGTTDGRDFVDGQGNTTIGDRFVVTGNNTAETFNIYTAAAAVTAGLTGLNTSTEIVVTRNGSIIAELDNIEEITINTLDVTANNGGGLDVVGSGDTIAVFGDFTTTSLNFSTITVNGSAGNDTVDISGLTSDHRVVFTSNGGNDTIVGVVRAQDVVDMDDILNGTGQADVLNAGSGADILNGFQGNDTLLGGSGNDAMNGGTGRDVMNGGSGNDAMNGGGGNDTFVFAAGFGDDTIRGFDANGRGGQDLLDISSYEFDDPGEFAANVSIADMGDYTVVTIGDDIITLLGVTGVGNNMITQADFII